MPRKTKIKVWRAPDPSSMAVNADVWFIQIGYRTGVYIQSDDCQILSYEPRFHKSLGWALIAEN